MTVPGQPPELRVIQGDATAEEIAALLAVVAMRAATSAEQQPESHRPVSTWANPAAGLRRPITAGPNAWQSSAWQR